MKYQHALQATRPHTYPLSIVGVLVGNALAYQQLGRFDGLMMAIFGLTLLTALALQILSNLANDYGDGVRGTDKHRLDRQFATGNLDRSTLKRLMVMCTLMIIVSGLALIVLSLGVGSMLWLFLGLGGACIIGALTYTLGNNPYGYRAKGELMVFVFFGLVNVLGSLYLQSKQIRLSDVYVAVMMGVLCACVLMINNLRDIKSDAQAGKHTLATLWGKSTAGRYYCYTLSGLWVMLVLYGWIYQIYVLATLVCLPYLIKHLKTVLHYSQNALSTEVFAHELKTIVKLTLMVGLILTVSHLA